MMEHDVLDQEPHRHRTDELQITVEHQDEDNALHIYPTEDQEEAVPASEEPAVSPPQRRPAPSTKRLVLFALPCLLAACVGVGWYLFPTPTATITIIPSTKQVTLTASLVGVPARMLPEMTLTQASSSRTTGQGHQDAIAAHGFITFFNAALYSQTVTTGTLLTGADGIAVLTDETAFIPAGSLATNGQATVSAHAIVAGPAGNIRAGDIYGPCCRLNVFVANGPFHGGQAERSYQSVAQRDIDTLATALKATLTQSVQAAYQAQLHSDETLLSPTCIPQVSPDHQAGAEASQVQVTVAETCSGTADQTQALQTVVTQQASRQLGAGYSLVGALTIQAVHEQQVKATASYAYQFTQEQQHAICTLVAGKSKAQATTALLHVPGVQSVAISIERQGTVLPTESKQIHLLFLPGE